MLVLKKYLALPTPDKSTISQVVCHFRGPGSVEKKKKRKKKSSSPIIKRT